MKFSDYIPEAVVEGVNGGFYEVLNGLHKYKEEEVSKTLRVNNPALLNDNKWILKRLEDYGFTNIPYEMPTAILQQVLLNVSTLLRTRGSKIGVQLFCSVFSLGEVKIDDSEFYSEGEALVLDSLTQGFVTSDSESDVFFLIEDTDILASSEPLYIEISSKYFSEDSSSAQVIKNFLNSTIAEWMGFNPGKQIAFSFNHRLDVYYHELLNKYFL